jgi:hypothetical protein
MTTIEAVYAPRPHVPRAYNEGIYDELLVVLAQHRQALASPQESVEQRFSRLAHEWRLATMLDSSTTVMIAHPAYLSIVAMGWAVVPLILRELARRPGHWSPALTAITGAVPYPTTMRGDIRGIAQAWLAWGRARGCSA